MTKTSYLAQSIITVPLSLLISNQKFAPTHYYICAHDVSIQLFTLFYGDRTITACFTTIWHHTLVVRSQNSTHRKQSRREMSCSLQSSLAQLSCWSACCPFKVTHFFGFLSRTVLCKIEGTWCDHYGSTSRGPILSDV